MSFTDPSRLWIFAALAAVLVLYLVVQGRRGRYALEFSDTSLLDTVAPRRPGWRRHLVAVTFLGAIALLIIAFAGPITERLEPRERAVVILTIDTSLSMGAEDVEPTRIDAAKQAASAFVAEAPPGIDIGVISFNEAPIVEIPPTPDRFAVEAAIGRLELGPSTNTGDALSTSLTTLERTIDALELADSDAPPGVVVLLSDGEPTVGRPIETAIAEAIQAGIPISTVALGTPNGAVTIEDPEAPGEFITVPVPVDEATLTTVAELTGGEFFSTSSAEELAAVYDDIGTAVGFEPVERDISDWFVGAALLAALLTSVLSLFWFQRLP